MKWCIKGCEINKIFINIFWGNIMKWLWGKKVKNTFVIWGYMQVVNVATIWSYNKTVESPFEVDPQSWKGSDLLGTKNLCFNPPPPPRHREILHMPMFIPPFSHRTPASSEWPQLWIPRPAFPQPKILVSSSEQETSSKTMVPVPWPKKADWKASVAAPSPRDSQTTLASVKSHPSSQTVPHSPL